MEIRIAHPEDTAAVAEVHIAARNTYYDGHVDVAKLDQRAAELRTIYRDMPERFNRTLWCAESAGEVIGMALTGPSYEWLGPWVGQLHQIHVHPDHWRRGIGTALHDKCVATWRESGVTVGVLEVWSQNDQAQSFYESHGWRPDGHTRPGPGDTTYLRLRRTII